MNIIMNGKTRSWIWLKVIYLVNGLKLFGHFELKKVVWMVSGTFTGPRPRLELDNKTEPLGPLQAYAVMCCNVF